MFDELWSQNPHAELSASGASVGLPEGQMGNSEVGHLTLGAGAAVPQTLTLIDQAVRGGGIAANPVVCAALTASERVHLVGLVSDGGVHSSFEHLHALITLASRLGVPDLVLHCVTDGRDTSPTAAADFLQSLEHHCRQAGSSRVANVVGRFYAMDRDRRWERIQAAYDLFVHGRGEHHSEDGPSAARAAYTRGETDEFITPTPVGTDGRIRPQDSVLCFNFRPDRMREIVRDRRTTSTGGVVTAQLVADADHDDPAQAGRHRRLTVRFRKCVAHEMQESWLRIACSQRWRRSSSLRATLRSTTVRSCSSTASWFCEVDRTGRFARRGSCPQRRAHSGDRADPAAPPLRRVQLPPAAPHPRPADRAVGRRR